MNDQFNESDLDLIIKEAKRLASPGGLSTLSSETGACVAVMIGHPDRCTQLTREQCAYVDSRLKSKSAGRAEWSEGNCTF